MFISKKFLQRRYRKRRRKLIIEEIHRAYSTLGYRGSYATYNPTVARFFQRKDFEIQARNPQQGVKYWRIVL